MFACQKKRLPRLVVQWMFSGGSDVSYKFGTLSWMVWISGVLWGVPLIFIPVVAAGGKVIFILVHLGTGIPKVTFRRNQIHPIRRP